MVGADYVEDLFGAALGLDAVLEGRESVAPRLLPLVADGAGGEAAGLEPAAGLECIRVLCDFRPPSVKRCPVTCLGQRGTEQR